MEIGDKVEITAPVSNFEGEVGSVLRFRDQEHLSVLVSISDLPYHVEDENGVWFSQDELTVLEEADG